MRKSERVGVTGASGGAVFCLVGFYLWCFRRRGVLAGGRGSQFETSLFEFVRFKEEPQRFFRVRQGKLPFAFLIGRKIVATRLPL